MIGTPDAYFRYVVVGIILTGVLRAATSSAAAQRDVAIEVEGTLEALAAQPMPAAMLGLGWSVWPVCEAMVDGVLTLVIAVPLGFTQLSPDWVPLITCLVLSVAVFLSIGFAAAALVVATQQGGQLPGLVTAVLTLLSGAFFPLALLPAWLRAIANLSPLTWALRALRASTLPRASTAGIVHDLLAIVAGSAVVLLPISLLCLSWALPARSGDGPARDVLDTVGLAPPVLAQDDLALGLVGTRSRRQACADRILDRARVCDPSRLLDSLGAPAADSSRDHAAERARGGTSLATQLAERMGSRLRAVRWKAVEQEMLTHSLAGTLEEHHIRAVALKGTVLARRLFEDPALRESDDVDLLGARRPARTGRRSGTRSVRLQRPPRRAYRRRPTAPALSDVPSRRPAHGRAALAPALVRGAFRSGDDESCCHRSRARPPRSRRRARVLAAGLRTRRFCRD